MIAEGTSLLWKLGTERGYDMLEIDAAVKFASPMVIVFG